MLADCVRAGVRATRGSALVSANVTAICRIRLPSQLFMKIKGAFRSLMECTRLPAILGTSKFQVHCRISHKGYTCKGISASALLHITRLCEPSH